MFFGMLANDIFYSDVVRTAAAARRTQKRRETNVLRGPTTEKEPISGIFFFFLVGLFV